MARWKDDEVAVIRQCAERGLSATVAAKATGRTRNAVIGKAHREGIKFHAATGGAPPGEAHPLAKLTDAAVLVIRRIWAHPPHPSMAALGKRYGVSRGAISNIVYGRNWTHVRPRKAA